MVPLWVDSTVITQLCIALDERKALPALTTASLRLISACWSLQEVCVCLLSFVSYHVCFLETGGIRPSLAAPVCLAKIQQQSISSQQNLIMQNRWWCFYCSVTETVNSQVFYQWLSKIIFYNNSMEQSQLCYVILYSYTKLILCLPHLKTMFRCYFWNHCFVFFLEI